MRPEQPLASVFGDPHRPFVAGVTAPTTPHEAAFWFLFQGDKLIVSEAGHQLAMPSAPNVAGLSLSPLRVQYLGLLQAEDAPIHCYSGELDESAVLPPGFAAVDLRGLFDVWDDAMIGLAGRAKQVAHWDRDHQYCGRCGAGTESMEMERAKRCVQCGLTNYPRLSPAVIIAVTRAFDDGETILLARNHRFPAGRYSVVAGFVEPGETLEECAAREVHEEVGIDIQNIRYFGSQPWPFPNSLMIGFTAEYAGGDINLEESEIAEAQWFSADGLPQIPPKISIARRLIDWFVARNGGSTPHLQDW